MKSYDYSVNIVWSQEDGAYIAGAPELPGCLADGQTREEALANLRVVVNEWLETAKADGQEIPQPMSTQDYENLAVAQAEALRQQIQNGMNAALKDLTQRIAAASQSRRQQFGFPRAQFDPAELHRE
jgi:predicted RNase H-like HicB family nuclease